MLAAAEIKSKLKPSNNHMYVQQLPIAVQYIALKNHSVTVLWVAFDALTSFSRTLIQQNKPKKLEKKVETGPSTAYVKIDDDNVVHKEDIQDSMLDGDICGVGDLLSSLLLLRRSIQ